MLFNSIEFICYFLPIVCAGFFLIARTSRRLAGFWLVVASLFFYGWWDVRFIPLLVGSIAFNYVIGALIGKSTESSRRSMFLLVGIVINLTLLGIFKYSNFAIETINSLTSAGLPLAHIVLPLGISFFTFTQLGYLLDVYAGQAKDYRPDHYLLFVTYFPHLIAGPILHHKQMMPQFDSADTYRIKVENISAGITTFLIGLGKKVVLADNLAVFVRPVFHAVDFGGQSVTLFEAWGGVLAYAFQLYFDFSGYSDMAIGASRLFGIQIPLNFNSPFKSPNITEYWRRFHMSLSQWVRTYLYYPLDIYFKRRRRKGGRWQALMISMTLIGLWHGANWTFVVFGALHGAYMCVHDGWQRGAPKLLGSRFKGFGSLGRVSAVMLTFLCVLVAFVFFRAETFRGAGALLIGMSGANGAVLPEQIAAALHLKGIVHTAGNMQLLGNAQVMGVFEQAALIGISMFICWCLPNTQNMSPRQQFWALVASFAFTFQAVFIGRAPSEFLYFQF
jgi:alginate O-acetyltransferase complex protein AlgI